jgi:hypothetical protein
MEEVESMASLAKDRITQRNDEWDNTKWALLPGFSGTDLNDVKGKLQPMVGVQDASKL